MNGIGLQREAESETAPGQFDAVLDARAATDSAWLAGLVRTCRERRGEGFAVRWWIPLIPELVYRLETLFSQARDEGFELVLGEQGGGFGDISRLGVDEKLFVWDFVTYRLLEEEVATLPAECAKRYRSLQQALGFPSSSEVINTSAEVAEVCLHGLRGVFEWTRSLTSPQPRVAPDGLASVLVIGAYGGEHIGDTAILGGVLLRIHQRYGTTRAILLTQRPAHTKHLVPMLEVPVEIEVESYAHDQIDARLAEVDGVVFAGGPLIELPKQLVRHLYAAASARRKGKPFIMEGIGPGPFIRWPSRWIGRRLVKLAGRISVRTSEDAGHPLVRDRSAIQGRDPAFDYLASRPATLTRLPRAELEAIEGLLRETAGRPVVGINMRPIRPLFTDGAEGQNRAAFTRAVEARFEKELAEGLQSFADACPVKPCFVFFPMNAIQFGQSDLRSAYRLGRLLDASIDFRVWEADASLDGVIALLRRFDAVIAMRFHAAIFALSQKRKVIGIDYRIGRRDKVAALLSDFDQEVNCQRIDKVTGEWLMARLLALVGPAV